MPRFQVPTSFTAGRKFKHHNTTYQPGDVVPNEVVKTFTRLSALLSRRFLIPNVDPNQRRTPLNRQTRSIKLPPKVQRDL